MRPAPVAQAGAAAHSDLRGVRGVGFSRRQFGQQPDQPLAHDVVGFASLTVAWLLVAVGMGRQGTSL